MVSVSLKGRLGNHLWQYAVCRSVADCTGYSFHIPRTFLGHQIHLNCDLGEPEECINTVWDERSKNNDDILLQKFDPEIFSIADGTRLDGFFQTEKYLLNKDRVKTWFSVPDNTSLSAINLDDRTCIIHFRGTDYLGNRLIA